MQHGKMQFALNVLPMWNVAARGHARRARTESVSRLPMSIELELYTRSWVPYPQDHVAVTAKVLRSSGLAIRHAQQLCTVAECERFHCGGDRSVMQVPTDDYQVDVHNHSIGIPVCFEVQYLSYAAQTVKHSSTDCSILSQSFKSQSTALKITVDSTQNHQSK